MSIPTLKLTFDKGPRAGHTLACNPARPTRIGRVVKGNTLAVKDLGISQSHLLLAFLPDLARWTATDLATSNGTLLNALPLPPSLPAPLSHLDVLKIGETTSITVHIDDTAPPPPPPRRGRKPADPTPEAAAEPFTFDELAPEDAGRPRRRGRTAAAPAVDPAPEAAEAVGDGRRGRRRGARAVSAEEEPVLDAVAEDVVEDVAQVKNARRGRRAAAATAVDPAPDAVAEDVVEEVAQVKNARRGRRAAAAVDPAPEAVAAEEEAVLDAVAEDVVEEVAQVKNARRGRRAAAAAATAVDPVPDAVAEDVVEEVAQVKNARRGRRAAAADPTLEAMDNAGTGRRRGRGASAAVTAPAPSTSRVTRSRVTRSRGLNVDPVPLDDVEVDSRLEVGDGGDAHSTAVEAGQLSAVPEVPVEELRGAGKGESLGLGTSEGGEMRGVGEDDPYTDGLGDNWRSMTLGQWIDRLDIFLARKINEAADERIAELRSMAARFDAECSNHMACAETAGLPKQNGTSQPAENTETRLEEATTTMLDADPSM